MGSKVAFTCMSWIWNILDRIVPKQSNTWAFATHHIHSGRFIENQRAVFEYVKADAGIRKLIFYRNTSADIDIEGAQNYELVKLGTFRAFYLLLFCKVVFVTHSIAMDFSIRFGKKDFVVLKVNLKKRLVVNLWHGIPIKRLLYAANDKTRKHTDRVSFRQYERKHYAGLIASSDLDGLVMAAMFYPLNYLQTWVTGLPRNDFLLMEFNALPGYIKKSVLLIKELKQQKRLVIYAPTYRQTDISKTAYYYQFTNEEIAELRSLLQKHNAILGYRPHYFKNNEKYFNLDKYIDNEAIFDISQAKVSEFSAIARECDMLVTDYSSVCLETMYLGKPCLSFAYDLENYKNEQDGLIYDLSMIFGDNVYTGFAQLLHAIDGQLSNTKSNSAVHTNEVGKAIFFKFDDCNNALRVTEKVKSRLT